MPRKNSRRQTTLTATSASSRREGNMKNMQPRRYVYPSHPRSRSSSRLGVGQAVLQRSVDAQGRTRPGAGVRSRSAVAEAAAEPLAARHDDRRLGRRRRTTSGSSIAARRRCTRTRRRSSSDVGECCRGAPPVLVFDQAGNLVRAWGGRARATSGRNRTTASTSITRATCGSAATAPKTRTSSSSPRTASS